MNIKILDLAELKIRQRVDFFSGKVLCEVENFHRQTIGKLKHLKISMTTKHMTFLSIGAV